MANRIFTVAKRSDVDGMGIYFDDLHPNSSQKSSTYDGEGESHYLRWFSKDAVAHTAAVLDVGDPGVAPIADNTVVGGNDVTVTQRATGGLLAYLRTVVHVNPGAADRFMTAAEALNVANDIYARVIAGSTLTDADIVVLLDARCAGADNELSAGESFGSVEEILRILAGEVYSVAANTILGAQDGHWLSEVQRDVLVAAATEFTAFSKGLFNTARRIGTQTRNGSVNISAGEGKLFGFAAATFGFTNPAHAYVAAHVTAIVPRAVLLDGNNIAATGVASALAVYDSTGAILAG